MHPSHQSTRQSTHHSILPVATPTNRRESIEPVRAPLSGVAEELYAAEGSSVLTSEHLAAAVSLPFRSRSTSSLQPPSVMQMRQSAMQMRQSAMQMRQSAMQMRQSGRLIGGFIALLLITWFGSFKPVQAMDPIPESITIVSWNLEWFFDANQGDNFSSLSKKLSAPNDAAWKWKIKVTADAIARLRPTILALQEIESKRTLHELASALRKRGLRYRVAFIEGFDRATEQDVGLLFQGGLVEFSRREQSNEMFRSRTYYNLSKHLFARFEWGSGDHRESLILATSHFRAAPEKRDIRQRQARLLRHWLEPHLKRRENVVILGDFNVEQPAKKTQADDPVGIMLGLGAAKSDRMLDLLTKVTGNPGTHLTGKQFDRILVSPSMIDDANGRRDMVFKRCFVDRSVVVRGKPDEDHRPGIYTIPEPERDVSDHYPIGAVFDFR